MGGKKLVKILIYLILFLLVANFLANKFYWYHSIWCLDMFMHFLGGFWVGIACLHVSKSADVSFKSIFKILFFVLLIGIGWELFEILVNDVIAQNPFNYLDTFSDILFDLAGGTLAILYFFKRIMLQ